MNQADETLLSSSAVYLFGRLLSDLKVNREDDENDAVRPQRVGQNNFLKAQLRDKDAGFARIFSFTYEGRLYELGRPTIFLVHGGGLEVGAPKPPDANFERLSRSPGRVTRSGLGFIDGDFAMDIRVWVYDKGDYSIRLDVETGTLEEILLSFDAGPESGMNSNGVMARSSGGMARSSGGMARSSGGMARSSGGLARSSGWRSLSDDF